METFERELGKETDTMGQQSVNKQYIGTQKQSARTRTALNGNKTDENSNRKLKQKQNHNIYSSDA